MPKFYITTPVYYVNDKPHIGHTYTTIAADILARYHRMIGDQTFFLTGTDEHGAKIEEKASEQGQEPQQFADEIAAQFELTWRELDVSNDNFLRTTSTEHISVVQKALTAMYEKGDIYLGEYRGLYCRGCEQFKSQRDLVDGLCPDHKIKPEEVSEECYMFKLSKYQDELLNRIKNNELRIMPEERKNEIVSFYEKEGLQDISFSRKNVKWGIPLPWDKSHTVYVWADAFLNYLTGLDWDGNPLSLRGVPPWRDDVAIPGTTVFDSGSPRSANASLAMTELFWPPNVQLMSKDIIRVHATIWPAMLLSLGLPLPKQLYVHGYFLIDGQKMSKSLGNVITPAEMIKKYGVDATRYLLMSATGFGSDSDISWQWFDEKYNADLANGLGNLVARSLTLWERMQNANIKMKNASSADTPHNAGSWQSHDKAKVENWGGYAFSHDVDSAWEAYRTCLNTLKIDRALSLVVGEQEKGAGMVRFLDRYITTVKPWELIKNNNEQAGVVIYNILERLRHIAWMAWPFMPSTAEKIWISLGLDPNKEMKKEFKKAIEWGGLSVDVKVKKGESLFPRI